MKSHKLLDAMLVGLVILILFLPACTTPTPEIIEKVVTKEVEKVVTKEVEKVVTQVVKETVKETVVVEGTPQVVEKEVTRIVEKVVTPTPEPLPDVTMRAAHYAKWDTFNPLTVFGGNMVDTAQRVFSPLVALDLNYKPFGDLAESWEVSEDGTTYTFHLRKNVKFHDGEPFNADDVLFSFHAAANAETGSAYASSLEPIVGAKEYVEGEADTIAGITGVDEYTVEMKLQEPSSWFLVSLTKIYILPEHILGKMAPEDIPASDFSTRSPIGTGPYKLVNFDEVNQVVTYEAYRDYHWGTPKISRVEWVWIPKPEAQIVAFEKGEIDYAPWHIWGEGHYKQAIPIPHLINKPRTWAYVGGLSINVAQPYFEDTRVRQAIFHALNRKQFLDDVGMSRLYTGFFDTAAWARNPDVDLDTLYPYDPDKARELLAEAGWDPDQEVVLYATVTGADPIRLAIQQMLGEVGIKVKIEQVEVAVVDKAVWEDDPPTYDLYIMGFGLDDPGLSVHSALSCDSQNNIYGYCNPDLDALLEQDRKAKTVEERIEILRQVEAMLAADPVLVPLTYSPQYVGFTNEWDIPRYSWYTFPYMHEWAHK